MIVTKSGIRVISYVHTERGLVDCDELTPEEKVKAATAIKLKWCNELYRGKAVFEVEASPSPAAAAAPSPAGGGKERTDCHGPFGASQ